MDEGELLELLEFYQDIIEKQNEIIFRLTRLVKQQAEALVNYRQVMEAEELDQLQTDRAIADEVYQSYMDIMEP